MDRRKADSYLSAVAIVASFVFRCVPTLFKPVMITMAISAAIKPYSMAVAAVSSRINRKANLTIRPIRMSLSPADGNLSSSSLKAVKDPDTKLTTANQNSLVSCSAIGLAE
jgi:hypothetical protein